MRTLRESVSPNHHCYDNDRVHVFLGESHNLPEAKDGPVMQPGSSLGHSLSFGDERYGDDGTHYFHVSGAQKKAKSAGSFPAASVSRPGPHSFSFTDDTIRQ